jgi:hypothetical protein
MGANRPQLVYSATRLATFLFRFLAHPPFGVPRPTQLNRIVSNLETALMQLSCSARFLAETQPGRVIFQVSVFIV